MAAERRIASNRDELASHVRRPIVPCDTIGQYDCQYGQPEFLGEKDARALTYGEGAM